MVTNVSRRSLVLGVLGGTTVIGIGGYGGLKYSRRNDLDLDLVAENRSDMPVELSLVVLENGDVFYERTDDLAEAGDENQNDVQGLGGPWIKERGPYSLQISAVNESMELTNEEILDRLGAEGWGVKPVNVEIVITEDRTLETTVLSPGSD